MTSFEARIVAQENGDDTYTGTPVPSVRKKDPPKIKRAKHHASRVTMNTVRSLGYVNFSIPDIDFRGLVKTVIQQRNENRKIIMTNGSWFVVDIQNRIERFEHGSRDLKVIPGMKVVLD